MKGYFTYDAQTGVRVYYTERIGAKPDSGSLRDWYRYVRVLNEEQRLINKINEKYYLGMMFQLVILDDDIFNKAFAAEEEVNVPFRNLQNWINMAIDWMREQGRGFIEDMSRWLHEIECQCHLLARLLGLKYRDELFSCVLFKHDVKHILVHIEMNEKSDFTYIGGIAGVNS